MILTDWLDLEHQTPIVYDEDDMFGDDIALDDLLEISSLTKASSLPNNLKYKESLLIEETGSILNRVESSTPKPEVHIQTETSSR